MDATENDVLEQLYCRYYGPTLLYTLSLCGNASLAEDIVSDAFVKAYLSLPNETPSFRFWLLRVCKNLWIDHLRREKHSAGSESLPFLTDPTTPEALYLQEERSRALWQAIAALSPSDREIVTLHYFSGLSLQEIAQLTGNSYPAVRQRMTRLRHTLKQHLEEQGYGL